MFTGSLHPDLARQEEYQRCLSRIYEYCVLQIDQEEQQVEEQRRRTTHFTSSKHKPSLPLRKETGFSDGSQLGFGDAPVRIEKVRVSRRAFAR